MKNKYRSTIRACYLGSVTLAIGSTLSPLLFVIFRESFSLSLEMLGRLVLINFITQLVADVLAIKLVPKVGLRVTLVFAHAIFSVGMIMLGVLPNIMTNHYLALMISTVVFSYGSGTIEATTSSVIDSLPSDAKASDMSLLHSIFCWGQVGVIVIVTLMLKVIGSQNWWWLALLSAVLPLVNAFLFTRVPFAPPLPEEERISLKKLFGKRIFVLALVLMGCAGASELAMSQWASLFAEKGLGVSKIMGDLLGPCLFAVLMGTGRLLFGLFGEKLKLERALLFCSGLCIISYLGVTLIPVPAVALIFCGLCGFSVSLMWPGMLSLCSERFHGGGSAMFALLAMFGDLGCSVGPWLTGLVADNSSLNTGLLVAIVFPVMMLVGVALFAKKPKEN